MTKYLFVPFTSAENNGELLTMANQWINRVSIDPRGKEPPKLLFYNLSQNKPLRIIDRDDTVYVLAHGHTALPGYVANVRAPLCQAMDHNNLAARLKVAGLPLDHRRVKLYICNAGGQMRVFAADFKRVMQGMGYVNIDVYSYDASVSIPQEFADGQYHKEGVFLGVPYLLPRIRASEVRHRVP